MSTKDSLGNRLEAEGVIRETVRERRKKLHPADYLPGAIQRVTDAAFPAWGDQWRFVDLAAEALEKEEYNARGLLRAGYA